MKAETILVVGASGMIGSELVRLLKQDGYKVKKTTSKKTADAESVYVDVKTKEGIKEAFDGIDKVFLLCPGGLPDQYSLLAPFISEAKNRKVKKLVLMTAFGANASDETPYRKAELDLIKSGLTYVIVRPNWFMQNFNTYWVQGIKEQGKIFVPAGDAKTSFIDTRDISAVIEQLLINDKYNNQEIDITGPESLSHSDVAKILSTETGKNISYQEIKPDDLRQGLNIAGVDKDYTEFLLAILGFLKEGYNAPVNANVKNILGREPRSFKEYAHDFRQSW